ncbi:MAG: SCP2 sterol-binding domain-containing protein [Gammaproteobacteria bacterium]|jgi:O2-independent ubiquinone biosynthesis accessory factor UbiT
MITTATSQLKKSPTLPRPLALPLSLIPPLAHSTVLVALLNRLFAPELADGEMDFLQGKICLIRVRDAKISYYITMKNGELKAAPARCKQDVSIEGDIYDFMLLATRQEDPDTLFFNRRLRLGGSTELGLFIKNFLDSLEFEDRLGPILKLMDRATRFIGNR